MASMTIGHIQIRTEPAVLNYDFDVGKYDMKQPKANFELRQPRADMHIEQPLGKFTIDSSKAWDALGVGGNLEMMSRIYSQAPNIALQGLAKIVERGNRMADLTIKGNAFAEYGDDWRVTFPEFDTTGQASVDNVDVHYEPGNLVIQATPRPVELTTSVNPPEAQYTRGKSEMVMASYGKVEITPPAIDTLV